MWFLPLYGSQETAIRNETVALAEQLRRIVGKSTVDAITLAEALQRVRLSLPFLETWTVPDAPGSLVGDFPWRADLGTNLWGVVTNAVQLQGTGGSMPAQGGRITVNAGTDDLRAKATIEEWHDTGSGVLQAGPMVRMLTDTSFTGYVPFVIAVDGVTTVSIQRFTAGVQVQIGPSVAVTPHAGMTIAIQASGALLSLYFDDVRLISASDPGGLLTGRFVGLLGVATGTNRVRVTTLEVVAAGAGTTKDEAELLGLTEDLRRGVARSLPESVSLTEALDRRSVFPRPVAEQVGLAEVLGAAATRPRAVAETVGLFEALGILVQTHSPQLAEPLTLTEALLPKLSGKAAQEVLGLVESLSRVFQGPARVGIIQLMEESVLVSGAGRRSAVTARGACLMPVPERTGLEYTADLVGREGVIVVPSDLAVLEITLYNLADLAIINGISRLPALNVGKGRLTDAGHLVITLDAADCAILDDTQAYEHHVLLVEGSYDGAQRAFRRAIDHVVVNLAMVP